MKRLLILLLIISSVAAQAQITIDERSIPVKGDTLWNLEDNVPNVNLGRPGTEQTWDFTSLNSGIAHKHLLQGGSTNLLSNNIDYDFVHEINSNTILFYKRRGKELYEVGVQMPHPLNSSVTTISGYKEPKLWRYADMKFEDDQTATSLIYFTLANHQIPLLIKKKLPITADSIRIKVEEIQDLRIDAWGTLSLSYRNFNVLRQDQTIHRTVSAEVFSTGKWSRINDNILDPGENLLGNSTERYYHFYASKFKEPIASIKVSNTDQPIFAIYRASESLGNIININEEERAYVLSPNPSFGEVKLELMNADFGTYKFEIFNVIGKKIWNDELLVNRKFTSYKYDFSFLGKGTYLWALTDNKGNRIITKRLVIITP